MRAVVLAAALALAGCATTRGPAVVLSQPSLASQIPQSLRHCRERPAVRTVETQADVAAFLVRVDEAGEDCRRRLKALDGAIDDIDAASMK